MNDSSHRNTDQISPVCCRSNFRVSLQLHTDIQFKNRITDLSIAILKEDSKNRDFGKDALNVILNFAFYEKGLHKVKLSVHSNAILAIKLYSSIGFVKEETDRETLFQDRNWLDIYYYRLRMEK